MDEANKTYGPAPQWLVIGDVIVNMDTVARLEKATDNQGVIIVPCKRCIARQYVPVKDLDNIWPQLQKAFTQGVK